MTIERSQHKKTQVLAVTGGKGGVGKSTIALNLGVCLARLGKKTCLLDADFGLPNIDVLLGLQPKITLAEVFRQHCELQDILLEGPFGLKIIPGTSGMQELVGMDAKSCVAFMDVFNQLSAEFDILVIDTAGGISEPVIRVTTAADEVLVVVCDEPSSLTDAYSLIKILNLQHQLDHFKILINMGNNEQHAKQVFSKLNYVATKHLNVVLNYLGFIPEDSFMRKAIRQQIAVVEGFPSCKSSIGFYQIAQAICNAPVATFDRGYMQFFMNQFYKLNSMTN